MIIWILDFVICLYLARLAKPSARQVSGFLYLVNCKLPKSEKNSKIISNTHYEGEIFFMVDDWRKSGLLA